MKLNEYQEMAARTSSLQGVEPAAAEGAAHNRYLYDNPDDDTRLRVAKFLPPLPPGVVFSRVDQGASGLSSEAGEVMEHVKHVRFHGAALDKEHLIKELGDALWYLAEAATGLGVTLEDVAQRNIAKLRARYPEGFTVERSENRDRSQE
jgi:NTP pyrophosphatase (non-canonical NTP hydrolase)